MPAVGELAILATHVQATQVHLVRLAVLELDEFAQACEELGVAVRAMLIGQDSQLVSALQADGGRQGGVQMCGAEPESYTIHTIHTALSSPLNRSLVVP